MRLRPIGSETLQSDRYYLQLRNQEILMSASKWFVVALLLSSTPAFAQGTAQTIMPPPTVTGNAAQIGNNGNTGGGSTTGGPISTPTSSSSLGVYTSPAARRNFIVTTPR
jgi:hypothetical protein